jgi:hypothetical protein
MGGQLIDESGLPRHDVPDHSLAQLLDVPQLERRELAAAQGAAQKHRQNRTVPFSFHSVGLGLSE